MAVSTMWIRNNMLRFDQHERKLTDAEMKIQRCLDSLTIPEWYLNKRSNPPKILNNTPFDCRPSPWKNPNWKKTPVMNLSVSTTSDTPSSESSKISEADDSSTGTYKIQRQQKSSESPKISERNNLSTCTYKIQRQQKSSETPKISEPNHSSTCTYKIQRRQKSADSEHQKSPPVTPKKVNTLVPDVKAKRDVSKTFPKMSPSRKVHNINVVLARGPPLNLSETKMEQKDADSVGKRSPNNSRRMSLVPEEFEDIGQCSMTPVQQRKELGKNADSPSTKFLTSRRKSTELENLVRSKKPPKEKSVVRGIIETLTEKANDRSSLPRQDKVLGVYQNFVKNMVDALESGDLSSVSGNIQESLASTLRIEDEEDRGNASESDHKSCAASMSPKYIDSSSSSDCDQRSPSSESDGSRRTFDSDGSLDTGKAPDDSVYWIPVSRCKLPRSSSLLSMMSSLSIKTVPSPCISPIAVKFAYKSRAVQI